MGCPSKCHNGI